MKKEEFPTFLNEQPTIIFGRTGRELLVIAIGLGLAYFSWLRIGSLVPGSPLATNFIKGLLAAILAVGGVVVAFVKVATRPLEEWAFVWLFYIITPKTYFYMPVEESISYEAQSATQEITGSHSIKDGYYEDD
jgi:hypothetical protein